MSLATRAHADICSAPVLTSLSPLMTLHCTGWGTVSIWCLLFWLTCWQANCLLLLRQWSSRSAAKPTWAFMWGLRVSVIMLVRQIHSPLNHTSSPHSYVLFICLLLYCVCTRYTHVPGCTCGSQKAALEFVLSFHTFLVAGIELGSFVWHALYLLRQLVAFSDPYFNLFVLQFLQLNLSHLSVYPLWSGAWIK